MKKLLLLTALTLFISCSKADFTKVKVGMATSELVDVVGQPNEKQDASIAGTYWQYDTHLVVIQKDTVNEFMTNEEFKQRMEDFTKGLEKLRDSLKK